MNREMSDGGRNDRSLLVGADLLASKWWAVVLRGVAGIIFGALTFVMPVVTLAVLVLLFGAYALVDGIFNIVAAVSGRSGARPWWALLLEGLVSVAAGLVAFFMPALTALMLAYVIAFWAIITGVLEIAAAIRLREVIRNEWWLGLSGAISIVFGVFLVVAPGPGALALVFWIGAYALVFGALLVGLGLRLRRRRSDARDEVLGRAA